jgi:hypothetical protein
MKEGLSRKTILHNQVQEKILEMLNNKEILFQNIPIENLEKNARLIKSFLYKEISQKYPKFNSYNKILKINQLNKDEIFLLLNNLPDLNEYSLMLENEINNRKKYTKKIIKIENQEIFEKQEIIENKENIDIKEKVEEEQKIETDILEIVNDLPLNNNSNVITTVFKLIKNIVIVYSFYKLFKIFI